MWTIFQVFIEFVKISPLFYVLFLFFYLSLKLPKGEVNYRILAVFKAT